MMCNKKNFWMCVYLEINLFVYDLLKKIYNILYMFWFFFNIIIDIKKEEIFLIKSVMYRYIIREEIFFL